MPQKTTFYPMQGGLDETTQALSVPRGRAISCVNYESVTQGYARVAGFERFSGKPSPTDAFEAQTIAAQAIIDREAARTAISAVPGVGPVRGVWALNGIVYAWRDNVALTKCAMFQSTAAGWVEVDTGYTVAFTSGGTYEILAGDTITGATSGATAVVRKVVATSGSWIGGTAAGYITTNTPVGTMVAENLNVGANLNVATIAAAPTTQIFPIGGRYDFETNNFYASAALRCFYGANGVGRGFEVNLTGQVTLIQTMPNALLDKPTHVSVYKDHLFFGFPQGVAVHSEPGEPLLFDGAMGATELGVGSPITGFGAAPGGALFIFSETKVTALFGNNFEDWTLETVTDEGGAFRWSIQRATKILYYDNSGVRSVDSTRDFGNFKMNTLTTTIEKTLQNKAKQGALVSASCVVKDKSQYRLFFDDGSGISIYLARKYPECMLFSSEAIIAYSVCTTKEELGQERIFMGATNGFVYELERGASFDGAVIEAYVQLPFDHEGSPLTLKKWHKVTLEVAGGPSTQIAVAAEFDYSNLDQPGNGATNFGIFGGGGGLWSINAWNTFYWSSPVAGLAESWIDGQGANMSLIVASTSSELMPYTLQGVTKSFSIRGTKR